MLDVTLSGQNSSASEVLAIRFRLLRGYENTVIFQKIVSSTVNLKFNFETCTHCMMTLILHYLSKIS